MQEIIKDVYEISIWEDVLVEGNEKMLPYFKEEKVAVIGANDHDAPELAYNPKFTDDVKGEHTLTFTMNGRFYNKELEEWVENPYVKLLTNEKKIKLFYRNEWYDLLIKKVEENKKNYSYNYTATDLFINELGKNGFKVELNVELENNQGTAEELAAQILENTDWKVSSYTDNADYKSDLLVETNLDTLYKATLIKDIFVKVSASNWLPIKEEDVEPAFSSGIDDKTTQTIKSGQQIYLFYSDLVAKNPEPMILYRADGDYRANENEDIIINSYNFRVTRENEVFYNDDNIPLPDFIDRGEGVVLEDKYRAYETIRRAETSYDPVTDKFITYYFQRLYTRTFSKTQDEFPYSNKEYFTKKEVEGIDIYERFYGYIFDKNDEYYELQYNEVLYDSELEAGTEYYIKTLVPEYIRLLEGEEGAETYYYDNNNFSYKRVDTNTPADSFIYKKSNKMVDGYVKYEGKEWPRLKGYTETEYLSPTLVQNYLANSSEFTDVDEGWLFDGSPSSKTRSGELVTRIDQDERYNFKENPASSMMVMHLTNEDIYYQSQTGNILYTSYKGDQADSLVPTGQIEYIAFDEKYDKKALKDYVNYIYPEPGFESYRDKADYKEWSDDAKKEVDLIYGFEYDNEELDEYTNLLLELANEIIDYDEQGSLSYILKLDLLGIKKKRLERKINGLRKNAESGTVQASINACLDAISSLIKNSTFPENIINELKEKIEDAKNNIERNSDLREKLENIKNNLSSSHSEIWNYIDYRGEQIKVGNEIFDTVISEIITTTTEVPNNSEDINLQNVTKQLMSFAKQNVEETIKVRFFEHISKRRYEAHSRAAINTGLAGNRKTIQKLNKGEEYVFALSLGRYKEGEEAPLYNKNQKVVYGDLEDKYYYFDTYEDEGIEAYVIDVDDYEQFTGDNPDGYMELDGEYIPLEENQIASPELIRFCIAQEENEGKITTSFVTQNSDKLQEKRYYEYNEGDYVRVKSNFITDNFTYELYDSLGNNAIIYCTKDSKKAYKKKKENWSPIRYRQSQTLICSKTSRTSNNITTYDSIIYSKEQITEFQPFIPASLVKRGEYKKNNSLYGSNQISFSLYKSDDQLPTLYCFIPDDKGEYVHIIYDEKKEKQSRKWYEFWKNTENLNKDYREFSNTDDLRGDIPHYFKRYNSNLDYDYHPASWKDGHFGPWKERYQRYTKYEVYMYDTTELKPDENYWIANPGEDGREAYYLYTKEKIERYTFHKDNNSTTFADSITYDSTNGKFKTAKFELVPVKLINRQYRPFKNEEDSQRITYKMLHQEKKRVPIPESDYVYCRNLDEKDLGYYRLCNKKDQAIYTSWHLKEQLDSAWGIYKFLKWKDLWNWNEDDPPFSFGIPEEDIIINEGTIIDNQRWVQEIQNGQIRIVPYDPVLHDAKKKFYRHTYIGAISDDNRKNIFYHKSGVYKSLLNKDLENTTLSINYDGLKVSFCEYDYNNSTYEIKIGENEEDKENRELFLEFDCSKPIDGYFDLEISPRIEMGDQITEAEKERYVWWKSPVLKNYNLTEDYFERIGMLFHTDSNEVKNYPIIAAQLFKYKTYKSNNYELLIKYRKQFYNYEQQSNESYTPTDEEVKNLKQAFQEYFGYQEWEKASEQIGIDKKYASYLEMLNAYFSKDEEKINYIKNKVAFNEKGYVIASDDKKLLQYIQELGYYNSSNLSELLSSSNQELINRLLSAVYSEILNNKSIMALPGEVPDNNDLVLTKYYLYNPQLPNQDNIDTLVYDYVGNDALSYYRYDYDDLCQKVRGIEVKEKNYLSALNSICEKFECWIKYELSHYTKEENEKLAVKDYENAHTPGEIKMIEQNVWVAEDDVTDIIFEPKSIFNTHISNKQNEAISAYDNFNPKNYWEKRKNYVEWDGHEWEEGVVYYEETSTGDFREVDKEQSSVPESEKNYYIYIENGNQTAIENAKNEKDKNYLKKKTMTPQKTIYLKQFTGDLNYAGFKYGINLKSIKRALDSKELVSRLIVKENTNQHAKDGFCTIQRATENPIKENFILNFDYYVQHKMLDKKQLQEDLYNIDNGYYSQLANINKNLTELATKISEVAKTLDEINANYETYSLARDAAQDEIDDMANLLSERLEENLPSPWKYDMDKQTTILRTSWSDTETKRFEVKDKEDKVIEMIEYINEGQDRAIEIPKYNEDTRNKLIQMDVFQRKYEHYRGLAQKAKEQKEEYEQKLEELYTQSDEMYRMKNNLNVLFFKKYYRFIQEGSWKEDKYMDDTLYYLDALAVLRTSAFPKVTYDIQVIDLETLKDYKGYSFKIGDKTYVEDTEFFGYTQNNKPYQEEVMVTRIEYYLDNASKNKITISNYRTQFEDLFKRIAATVAKVELSTGGYNRANAVINETSLGVKSNATEVIEGITTTINGSVSFGEDGIITTEIGAPSNKIRIVNGAIYRSVDGGDSYQKIISAKDGINPSLIGNGILDLTSLVIGVKDKPELTLTNNGITAFQKNNENIDYSTFVRFDNYGVYGIKNYKRNSSTDDSSNATLNDSFIPDGIDSIYENATYGLTWNGFFLNTGDGTGRVSIGTEQDMRMSVKNNNNTWQDRIVIGKLQDNEETYYGFRIIDDNENVVLNTDDKGQLYLRHKLFISHFNDKYGTILKDGQPEGKSMDQTNVTLGIVKAYKRNEKGGYDEGQELHENYSSLDYLTKVLSVKSAVEEYELSEELNNIKDCFKQFTKEQLLTLIDNNENLAIFDNGNLYAKNAWIEGNIHATSGTFTGTLTAARLEAITFSKDNISAIGGSLFIRPTCTALELVNYDEENKVLIIITDIKDKESKDFVPGIVCEIPISLTTETFIILEEDFIEETSSQYFGNKRLKLLRTCSGNLITNESIKNKPIINYEGINYFTNTAEFGTYFQNNENYRTIKLYNKIINNLDFFNSGALLNKEITINNQYKYNSDNIKDIKNEETEEGKVTFIILNQKEQASKTFTKCEVKIDGASQCISLVSSSRALSDQAISLYTVHYPLIEITSDYNDSIFLDYGRSIAKTYNSILGKFPEELGLEEKAGLYTNNGIFYGKILSQPKLGETGVFSGIDSNSLIYPEIQTRLESLIDSNKYKELQDSIGTIVMWAGAKNKENIASAPFIVDSKGNLFTNNAYITDSVLSNAIIKGSVLETSIIRGSGENPALIIKDSQRGIVIVDNNDKETFSINENNLSSTLKRINFEIESDGYFLVNNNFSIGNEGSQYRAAFKDGEQIGINLFIS